MPRKFNIELSNTILIELDLEILFEEEYNKDDDEKIYRLVLKNRSNNDEIGLCTLTHRDFSAQDDPLGYIRLDRIDIHQDKDQKKGLGTLLMFAVLEKLDSQNYKEVGLSCSPSNIEFYFKNGFCHENIVNKDEWYTCTLQEKVDKFYADCQQDWQNRQEFFAIEECFEELTFIFENQKACDIANERFHSKFIQNRINAAKDFALSEEKRPSKRLITEIVDSSIKFNLFNNPSSQDSNKDKELKKARLMF